MQRAYSARSRWAMEGPHMIDYARHLQDVPGQIDRVSLKQVRNSSGAYVFEADPFERLERFLILGAEGGTYYASERALVRENAASLHECLRLDPERAVRTIFEVSQWGRAPKQGPGIFALAVAASFPDPKARSAALKALPAVCRTGRSLLEFVALVDAMRGWGVGLRRAVGLWYTLKSFDDLAYQLTKYRGTGKDARRWTHRDVLRKAHPSPQALDGAVRALLRWAVGGAMAERVVKRKGRDDGEYQPHCGDLPERIAAFERLQAAQDVADVVALIERYHFTHEMVPSQFKKERAVWEALLVRMPLGALVRNLGKLTNLGILAPRSEWTRTVEGRLTEIAAIRRARLHPIAFLSAQMVYRGGHALQGGYARALSKGEPMKWDAVRSITDSLESAFYLAFGNVRPAGKRLLLALDVSGSMGGGVIAGVPGLTPAMAAAAMALVTLRTEPLAAVFGFASTFRELGIRADMKLDQAMKLTAAHTFGDTDCSLPFTWAMKHGVSGPLSVDGFVVYTDSETNNYGRPHPHLELQKYREKSGIMARSVVAAFTSNGFTIADPADAGMMDVVGFDTAAPAVIGDFFRGKHTPEANQEALNDSGEEEEAA